MRVTLVNTHDGAGGAARAARRLLAGLRATGIDARLCVQFRTSEAPGVELLHPGRLGKTWAIVREQLDRLPLLPYPPPKAQWSLQWLPGGLGHAAVDGPSDIVHLHWIGSGCVPVRALPRLRIPLVWTLHDAWPLTGGCHLPDDCMRYRERCGACPQLHSNYAHDASRWLWNLKARHWHDLAVTLIAPSRWLADCIRQSPLLGTQRIEVIPNGLDLERYRPHERTLARHLLDLPLDRPLILFGAEKALVDPNKGLDLLASALQRLRNDPAMTAAELLILGAETPQMPAIPDFPTRYLGRLHDDLTLSLVYAAADVFVLPSRSENLSNAVAEALACGTPAVAFAVGGMPELIGHRDNGWLAHPYDTDDLAEGIRYVLAEPERHARLARHARRSAEARLAIGDVVAQHRALYAELLAAAGHRHR